MSSDKYSTIVNECFERAIKAHGEGKTLSPMIVKSALSIIKALDGGGKVMIMGNGGSASDASHMAAELVGRFKRNRRPLPAIALTTDTALITAIANDFDYDQVFLKQCSALVRPGDVIIGISTSGRSKSVINAILECRKTDSVTTIGLTGNHGEELKEIVDILLQVPSNVTATIQEVHRTIIHAICEIIDIHYAEK